MCRCTCSVICNIYVKPFAGGTPLGGMARQEKDPKDTSWTVQPTDSNTIDALYCYDPNITHSLKPIAPCWAQAIDDTWPPSPSVLGCSRCSCPVSTQLVQLCFSLWPLAVSKPAPLSLPLQFHVRMIKIVWKVFGCFLFVWVCFNSLDNFSQVKAKLFLPQIDLVKGQCFWSGCTDLPVEI